MKNFLSSLFVVVMSVFAITPAFADAATATPTDTTTPAPVFANYKTYWGVTVGDGFQSENTNKRGNATFLGLKYGEDFGQYDLELEGFRSYTNGRPSIGNVDTYGVMLNGKYKWLNQSLFTPFVKAGVGLGNISGTGVLNDGTHLLLAGGVGTYYKLDNDTNLELAYTRHFSGADVRNNTWGSENYQDDTVSLGVNFNLN